MLLERFKNPHAIRFVRLVSRRAERRRRSLRDALQQVAAQFLERNELIFDNPAHAVARAQKLIDVPGAADFLDHADERLIDHRSRASRLPDHRVAF